MNRLAQLPPGHGFADYNASGDEPNPGETESLENLEIKSTALIDWKRVTVVKL